MANPNGIGNTASTNLTNINNPNSTPNVREMNGNPGQNATKIREVLESDETDISSLFNGDDGAPYLFQEEQLTDQYNDTGNGPIRYKEYATLTGHGTAKVVCCDFSADGKILASGGHDKKVVIWDVAKKSLQSTLSGHTYFVSDVRFGPHPSSSLLASGCLDKTIRLWKGWESSEDQPSCVGTLKAQAGVTSVDFHPNSVEMLCSVDLDGELRFWSLSNTTCINTISKNISKIARFQPIHGRYIAAGSENKVKLFDTTSLQEVRALQGHTRAIHSISWHPQTPKMVSGSDDCVSVWDVANPSRPLRSLSVSNISSCGFHPTFRSVVVIGSYQRVYLWDFESEKTVAIPAHDGIVSGLSSSFVSGLFATASQDTKVKLFC